ncbi:MAG: S-layer homology domain-containing protein [Thermoanaerobaculia bacterium]
MKKRKLRFAALAAVAALFGGAVAGVLADCGPFTDVGAGPPNFCPFILEMYYLGITAGTSPTTFAPSEPVTRAQMSVFIAKSFDQSLSRGSRRGALGQWWTPQNTDVLGQTGIPANPQGVASDGADIWVAHQFPSHLVTRVRASDGRLLDTWTGATRAVDAVVAMGRVFVAGNTNPGQIYMIDPTQPAGAVATVADALGASPNGIAFDGSRFWTANEGSVSIVTPGPAVPWAATTIATGFTQPRGIVFDGVNVWVIDTSAGLLKLDASGAILQSVAIGSPRGVVFDGTNLWVPGNSSELTVVRASTGAVLATLSGNGLDGARAAAFDGQRILVTNNNGSSASLWKAADLAPLGSFSTGAGSSPSGACSDGVNFWITLSGTGQLARF